MREILFRAKTKMIVGTYNCGKEDGEWVMGCLYHDVGKWIIRQFELDRADYVGYEVDPETIGQCTGLDDREGRKIFEGDILEWTRKDIVLTSSAYFGGYHFGDKVKVKNLESGFTLTAMKNNDDIPNIGGNINNYDFWNMHRFLRIVGNIFDNPEMINE